jgi:tRNA1(Val) A37 N6-methylase TrmN6
MALMFTRLARNFIKHGYFPTDEDTIAAILPMLQAPAGPARILDPCVGEGAALAEVKAFLAAQCASTGAVDAFGIEIDADRAQYARGLLDTVVHGNVYDVLIKPRSAGLLWLNPPYGDAVRDQARTAQAKGASLGTELTAPQRLEHQFLRQTLPSLQAGGVLVLIAPLRSLDDATCHTLASHCEDVRVYAACDGRFNQVVLLGIKRRRTQLQKAVRDQLLAIGTGALAAAPLPAPKASQAPVYAVPAAIPADGPVMTLVRLEAQQLAAELQRLAAHTLWPRMRAVMGQTHLPPRRPLHDLSRWHLALALAAGQIQGVVTGRAGERWLVKGNTLKDKVVHIETTEDTDGTVYQTQVHTDRFVPVIRAIDLTPGATLGQLLTIR